VIHAGKRDGKQRSLRNDHSRARRYPGLRKRAAGENLVWSLALQRVVVHAAAGGLMSDVAAARRPSGAQFECAAGE
jgi:hypothetical protein